MEAEIERIRRSLTFEIEDDLLEPMELGNKKIVRVVLILPCNLDVLQGEPLYFIFDIYIFFKNNILSNYIIFKKKNNDNK